MSLINDRYCSLLKFMILTRVCDTIEWLYVVNKNPTGLLYFTNHSNPTGVPWLCTLEGNTAHMCPCSPYNCCFFSQRELIDWPSMETRSLDESKQTWKSRPAKSLVSIPSARKAKPDLMYLWSDKTATTSSYCKAASKTAPVWPLFP